MNARIAASSVQIVQVQKVLLASRNTFAARLPGAAFACRDESSAYQSWPGKYRQDRNRSRVIETKGIQTKS